MMHYSQLLQIIFFSHPFSYIKNPAKPILKNKQIFIQERKSIFRTNFPSFFKNIFSLISLQRGDQYVY